MTTLGTIRNKIEVALNDSVELHPYLQDELKEPIDATDLASVEFTIKRPDDTTVTLSGTIDLDGSGFLSYPDTDVTGLYIWVVAFTFTNGQKKSLRDEFNVTDPFDVPPQTRLNIIADQVWSRVEDCFDSEVGGPWLRDMTLAYFDPTKVEMFIPEGLIYINNWPPLTNFGLEMFTTRRITTDPALPVGTTEDDPDSMIIVQSTLVALIRHLMRSYVEQPDVRGANIVYESRRDYLERWDTIYQLELAYFKELVALWKRQFLGYGQISLLLGQKAGRLGYGSGYRARNALRGW